MDESPEAVLGSFNITRNEAAIYLRLLGTGELTAYEIANLTGLNRTFTYDRLKKLIGMGLVSYVLKANKKYFKAAPPGILLSLLQEREQQVERMIPQLERMQGPEIGKDTAEIFSGNKGVRTVLGNLIKEKGSICIHGSLSLFKEKLSTFFGLWTAKCISEKRGLTALSYEDVVIDGWQIELLPKEEATKTTVFVCGNKTVTVLWKDDPIALQVTSQSIADDQRSFFNAIWKREIKIYSGVGGMRKAFTELLDNTKEYMGYGYSKELADVYSVEFSDRWHEERERRGIRNRIISVDTPSTRTYFAPRARQRKNFFVRFLPKNLMGPACVTLSDSLVATFIYTEKNQKIILNKNREAISVYQKHFEELWKISKS